MHFLEWLDEKGNWRQQTRIRELAFASEIIQALRDDGVDFTQTLWRIAGYEIVFTEALELSHAETTP